MKHLLTLLFFVGSHLTSVAGETMVTTSDGVQLYVKVEGQGTPLLYIHGGPGSGSHWFEQFFGEFMESQFTVVYLDQRGVGRSTSPENKDFSMDRLVKDFEEVRKSLGFKSWVTLGHSFGGILQMGYAKRHPEILQGMLMINCTLDLPQSACDSWLPKAAELLGEKYTCPEAQILPKEKMYEYGSKLREQNLFWRMGFASPETEKAVNDTYKEIPEFNYDFGNAAMNTLDYFENFKPFSSEIGVPVLYYFGTRDYMVGPDHHKGLKFPNLILWKGDTGHFPFLENKEDLEKAVLHYKNKYNL